MTAFLAIAIVLILLASLLLPFFVGPGGFLAEASFKQDPESIENLQQAILERYLADETAFKEELISQSAWDKRREFLVNRYIDNGRRLDFLKSAKG